MTWAAGVRSTREGSFLLRAFDAAALIVFTIVGVATHDGGLPADALVRVGIPLLIAWFAAARVVGVYRRPGLRTLLLGWVVSVPVAVLVRTAIARGPWGGDLLAFLAVAMVLTLLFLLIARVAAAAVRPRTGGLG